MSDRTYLDLDLLLERADEGYRARVLSSPSGSSGWVDFHPPGSAAERDRFLVRMGQRRNPVRRVDKPETAALKDFGTSLYDALFHGDVGLALLRGQSAADASDSGLRLRLRLADVPELADLPWEFLYDRQRNRFLALSERTPLVRYLELPDPPRVHPVRPPLRVLVMIASPLDLQRLDVEHEWQTIGDALADLVEAGQVVVERLPSGTLGALQRRLRRGDVHVLHFIGHGAFDRATEEGTLVLVDEHGRARMVPGQSLAMILHDHHALRLVVLNACEGARSDVTDPFAGTAQSLIQQGVPAVVAMQFEVTDRAAITLARELYAAVTDGYPLDAALTAARKSLFAEGNPVEWATPVLYLSAPDGRVFDVPRTEGATPARGDREGDTATGPRQAPSPVPTARPTDDPDYGPAVAAFLAQHWSEAVPLLDGLHERYPNHSLTAERLAQARHRLELAQWGAEASRAEAAGDWPAAVAALEHLMEMDADRGGPEASARLAALRARQRVAELRADVRTLHAAGQWAAVADLGAQISAVDPSAADPDGLVTSAQDALEELSLAGQYAAALQALDDGDVIAAEAALDGIERARPGFRSAAAILASLRAGRAAARQPVHEAAPVPSTPAASTASSPGSASDPGAMPDALTPDDVLHKKFQPTKFREGYDQDEVDDFLDAVVEELKHRWATLRGEAAPSGPGSALNASDVLEKRFRATKFRDGYDQGEVDDYLDLVVSTLRAFAAAGIGRE